MLANLKFSQDLRILRLSKEKQTARRLPPFKKQISTFRKEEDEQLAASSLRQIVRHPCGKLRFACTFGVVLHVVLHVCCTCVARVLNVALSVLSIYAPGLSGPLWASPDLPGPLTASLGFSGPL